MKKRLLALMLVVSMVCTIMGIIPSVQTSAADFTNPDPEVITSAITIPEENYMNGGSFDYDWIWWLGSDTTKYNTTDQLEGTRCLEVTPKGSWGGDAGLGAGGSSPFTDVPALEGDQLYKFTVYFKITNPTSVGSGLNDLILCGIMGGSSDALQVRICTDSYGSYGSNWIKVVKYADAEMMPNMNGAYCMISGTKTGNPITVLFDAMSLEIVEASDVSEVVLNPQNPYDDDFSGATNVNLNVDKNTEYQTMEGFGFYGGMGTMGNGEIYTDDWVDKMIDDLGLSMVRFELGPNTIETANSLDQKVKYIKALDAKAAERGFRFKVILTVWSPPAKFKTNNSTVDGGNLKTDCYDEYAQWLIDCLNKYKDAGIDIYALSLQNEPNFIEFYDSCVYSPDTYVAMLKACVPTIKASYPNLLIFGAENMLSFEGNLSHWSGQQYHKAIIADSAALKCIDAFSVHGYSDGVLAEAVAGHKNYWTNCYNTYCKDKGKKNWMTETSGFSDEWMATNKPSALQYGLAIGSAIKYGQASAWCHWTGSTLNSEAKDEFALMDGMKTGKRYAASKHFYNFVRPGDVMVKADTTDNNLLATAFINKSTNSFSTVLINSEDKDKIINIQGAGISKVNYYVTTSDPDTDCVRYSDKDISSIRVPAYSIVTVVDPNAIQPSALPLPTSVAKPTPTPNITPSPIASHPIAEVTTEATAAVSAPVDATPDPEASASPTPTGSKTKVSIRFVKKSKTIKVRRKATLNIKLNGARRAKFTTSKKKVVKIVSKKSKSVVIKGMKKGKAVITAKASNKTAKCKVTVKK